ncbi:hypothetical protein BBOMB_1024 [Bifidobacterium bombi DSM 19703]|uniref:Uncharacterized protein n=2 Tax=Bifidobacterium bombi TaxID=471511 RepID=A0A080N3B9_9BIFI|nr:hypothetical protein BBOMB_1024 [Bifidobacterium bombi DSM 19703]
MSDVMQAEMLTADQVAQALPGDVGATGPTQVRPIGSDELARLAIATPDVQAGRAEDAPKHVDAGYTPVFNSQVRTAVYVLALVASVVGLGLMAFGHPDVGGFVSTAAGVIAAGFGVTYNPIRMTGK